MDPRTHPVLAEAVAAGGAGLAEPAGGGGGGGAGGGAPGAGGVTGAPPRAPVFGPVVLVGLGGVLAELLDDTAVRLAPVSLTTARAMLRQLRGHRLLAGYRGRPAVDLDALAALAVTVSRLAGEPPVGEVGLNPVLVRARA